MEEEVERENYGVGVKVFHWNCRERKCLLIVLLVRE